jgi:MoxR-vWA-beta-propeller ternary system domain bpX5
MNNPLAIQWRLRAQPLVPCAVVAFAKAVGFLGTRLLARSDDALAKLEAVKLENGLVVLGAANDLPWAPGVLYLGTEPSAPALLLPTTVEPSAHPALIERAILARHDRLTAPVALVHSPALMFSVRAARFLTRAALLDALRRAS